MKIVTSVEARPQFIKAAPVSKALREGGHREFILSSRTTANVRKLWWTETRGKPDPYLKIGQTDHGNCRSSR